MKLWELDGSRDTDVIHDDMPLKLRSRKRAYFGFDFDYPTAVIGAEFEFGEDRYVGSEDFDVYYWHMNWRPEDDAVARPGWEGVEDAWHGIWQKASILTRSSTGSCFFAFAPLSEQEFADYRGDPVEYRRTLKLAVYFKGNAPLLIRRARPLFPGSLAKLDLRFDWGITKETKITEISLSCTNAFFDDENATEKSLSTETETGMISSLIYAAPDPSVPTGDGNIPCLTICWDDDGFTVNLLDLVDGESVWLPDFDFLVRRFDRACEPAEAVVSKLVAAGESVYDKIENMPEQTLSRARMEIPKLDPEAQGRYVLLGTEANRGEFAIRYDSHIFVDKTELKLHQFDAIGLDWPGDVLSLDFGVGESEPERLPASGYEQSMEDGWIPIVTTAWKQSGIENVLQCFATIDRSELGDSDEKTGLECAFLLCKWTIRNNDRAKREIRPWIVLRCGEIFRFEDGCLFATAKSFDTPIGKIPTSRYESPRNRLQIIEESDGWTIRTCRIRDTRGEVR